MTMLCYVYSQGSLPCCCVIFFDQNVCVCACVRQQVRPRWLTHRSMPAMLMWSLLVMKAMPMTARGSAGKSTLVKALRAEGHRVEGETAERMIEEGIASGELEGPSSMKRSVPATRYTLNTTR